MANRADPIILNQWHVVAVLVESEQNIVHDTILLQERISYAVFSDRKPYAWKWTKILPSGGVFDYSVPREQLPARSAFGYLWVCLGEPSGEIFEIPEYFEPDRRNMNAATFGVQVSAPRAIENFLDMGHFPFVHTGILGEEPHTEVRKYNVEIRHEPDEILATQCRFFQPAAAVASSGGALVDYIYRVPHPYCSVLYKSSGSDPSRMDVVALFAQPVCEESIRAHMLLCILDSNNADSIIKRFQQMIFAQDKPILENQCPRRLPLDPRAETPIRADHSSVTYRRWLNEKGVTYGVIPASH